MTTPAKLVQLIHKSGHTACVRSDGFTLHVARKVVDQFGEHPREYTDIPATLPAVMRWLGY